MDQRPYVILAAVSFDDGGMSALHAAAADIRLRPDAELHLVHVVEERGFGAHDESSAKEELQHRLEALRFNRSITITAHIRQGSPSESILQTARELDPDVIVVGTRKRRGVEKLVHGSVAQRVVSHAHCPVLVAMPKDNIGAVHDEVEPPCPDCVALGAGDWCERHSRSRILVHFYEPSDTQPSIFVR